MAITATICDAFQKEKNIVNIHEKTSVLVIPEKDGSYDYAVLKV